MIMIAANVFIVHRLNKNRSERDFNYIVVPLSLLLWCSLMVRTIFEWGHLQLADRSCHWQVSGGSCQPVED